MFNMKILKQRLACVCKELLNIFLSILLINWRTPFIFIHIYKRNWRHFTVILTSENNWCYARLLNVVYSLISIAVAVGMYFKDDYIHVLNLNVGQTQVKFRITVCDHLNLSVIGTYRWLLYKLVSSTRYKEHTGGYYIN